MTFVKYTGRCRICDFNTNKVPQYGANSGLVGMSTPNNHMVDWDLCSACSTAIETLIDEDNQDATDS